jgi:hypothetical protein
LGANLNLGRGVVDLGRLSTAGLVTGAAAAAWLIRAPRREPASASERESELPPVHMPMRAVAGVICALISTMPASLDPALALGQFVNSSIAVSAAILTAGAYTLFTTRNTDVLSASRAALAAVFVASSGGALMPPWVLAALGVICGLLATIGCYAINERLRWQDDSAIITSVLAASAIGMLATGLFASGASGVSGAIAMGDHAPDPGQFVAQAVGVTIITVLSYAACAGALALMEKFHQPLLLPAEATHTRAPASVVVPAEVLTEVTPTLPEDNVATSLAPKTSNAASADLPVEGEAIPANVEPESAQSSAQTPAPAKGKGLLAWLRRSSSDPLAPKQPRRVAYPYRANGRRLATRPLAANGEDETRPPLAPSE